MVLFDNEERKCFIIDIGNRPRDKVEKYQDLRRELKRISKCKSVLVVPIGIGAHGTLSRDLMNWLGIIYAADTLSLLQKACVLAYARIL